MKAIYELSEDANEKVNELTRQLERRCIKYKIRADANFLHFRIGDDDSERLGFTVGHTKWTDEVVEFILSKAKDKAFGLFVEEEEASETKRFEAVKKGFALGNIKAVKTSLSTMAVPERQPTLVAKITTTIEHVFVPEFIDGEANFDGWFNQMETLDKPFLSRLFGKGSE